MASPKGDRATDVSAPHLVPTPDRQPRLIDDPRAPELFCTGCSGFAVGRGAVTLTLESDRFDHATAEPEAYRAVVGRLVLPLATAQALVVQLHSMLQRSGLDPFAPVTAGMTGH